MLLPHWDRTCEDCRRYEYDDEEESPTRGQLQFSRDGLTPLPRVYDPPCRRCPKVPQAVVKVRQAKGKAVTPADALDPDDRHREAVEHFLECAAVGHFPRDHWVRRAAMLLRPVLKQYEDRPLSDLAGAIKVLAGKVAR